MAASFASLLVRLGIDAAQFDAALNTAAKKFDDFGSKLQGIGTKLTIGVTAPLVGIAGASIKAASDFEQGIAKALSVTDDFSQQTKTSFEEAAKAISTQTTFSANQGADALFFLSAAGLNAADAIAVLPTVATFAQAGLIDLGKATDLLIGSLGALGLSVGEAERLTDVLAKGANISITSIEELSEALTSGAAASLRLVGKSAEEGVAVLAALAQQGTKGAEAGTQLGIVLRDLTTKAIGNKQAFADANIAVFDSSGAMRNLADIIEDLENSIGPMNDEMQKAALLQLGFSDRSLKTLSAMIGLSGQIREYEAVLQNAGGATQRMADIQLNTLNSQLSIVRNRFGVAAIELGNAFLPVIKAIIPVLVGISSALASVGRFFQSLPIEVFGAVAAFAALLAAIGPLLIIIGTLARSIGALLPAIKFLSGVSLVSIGIWGLVAGAVALLVGGLVTLRDKSYDVVLSQKDLTSSLKATGDVVKDLESKIKAYADRAAELKKVQEEITAEINRQIDVISKIRQFQAASEDGVAGLGSENDIKAIRQEIIELQAQLSKIPDQLRAIENQQAINELELASARATEVIRELNKQTADNASFFTVAGDAQRFYSEQIAAYEQAIRSLIPLVGANDERLKALIPTYMALKASLEALNSTQVGSHDLHTRINQAVAESVPLLAALDAKQALFGNSTDIVSDRLSVLKAVLDAVTEEGVKELSASQVAALPAVQALAAQIKEQQAALKALGGDLDQTKEKTLTYAQQMQVAAISGQTFGSSQLAIQEQLRLTQEQMRQLIEQSVLGLTDLSQNPEWAMLNEKLLMLQGQVALNQSGWVTWFDGMQMALGNATLALAAFSDFSFELFKAFADGFGQSVGRAIVYGEDFGDAFKKLLKDIGVKIIATLISLGIQLFLFAVISALFGKTFASSLIAAHAAVAYAGAFAQAVSVLPFPFGLISAIAYAKGAVIAQLAGASAAGVAGGAVGFASAASGGLTMGEGFVFLHPREVIAPFDRVQDMLTPNGAGNTTVIFEMDGRPFARAIVPHMPGVIRRAIGPDV